MSDDITLAERRGATAGIVRCDACPVLCRIRPGRAGACDRYANEDGKLVRVDPLVLLAKRRSRRRVVPFVEGSEAWDGELGHGASAPSSPASAPAPPIPTTSPRPSSSSSRHDGVDMVTVVTEGIFSYCGVKVKIDTDRYLGPEQAAVRVKGEAVGHVTTAEYGSQMLSLGGVHHLTGGSKKEGSVTCEALLALVQPRGRSSSRSTAAPTRGRAGRPRRRSSTASQEERMRVGCGSADDRHLRAAVARPCRRGDRGRRPHHRRADRAPGRPLPRHDAGRHPRARPQVDARPLLPGRRARARAGAAPTSPTRWRSSRDRPQAWPGPACAC